MFDEIGEVGPTKYLLSSASENWEDANDSCKRKGGKLLQWQNINGKSLKLTKYTINEPENFVVSGVQIKSLKELLKIIYTT